MPRAQSESLGKLEQRSIIIITVTTHICILLYCLPSTLSTLTEPELRWGRGVGKISLRICPILCASRINGLKQIRNRLNEVPLVKQKSNYMIGNCNNPSQASALWIPMLAAVSASICCWMHRYRDCPSFLFEFPSASPLSYQTQVGAVTVEQVIEGGT